MLLQLIAQHPEAIGPVLRHTPGWVWGMLAALLALGISQMRDRSASLARVSLMPIGMSALSVWGTWTALSGSRLLPDAILVWLALASLAFVLLAPGRTGARFDPQRRMYAQPGSVVPLLLIVGIFMVKYVVGVDLAMDPRLMQDATYVLSVAGLYGAVTGIFVGRAARLWRLALHSAPAVTPAAAGA